jgi:2',3'-cyclic-nucleotide 2'-phosphodiesterase (5'-nucleotidase family)
MQFKKKLLLGAMLSAAAATTAYADGQVTIIHIGDIHGHLSPRPNLRSTIDYANQKVGGLARMKTEIKKGSS